MCDNTLKKMKLVMYQRVKGMPAEVVVVFASGGSEVGVGVWLRQGTSPRKFG